MYWFPYKCKHFLTSLKKSDFLCCPAGPCGHQRAGGDHHKGSGASDWSVPRRTGAHRSQAWGDGSGVEQSGGESHTPQGETPPSGTASDVLQRLQGTYVSSHSQFLCFGWFVFRADWRNQSLTMVNMFMTVTWCKLEHVYDNHLMQIRTC